MQVSFKGIDREGCDLYTMQMYNNLPRVDYVRICAHLNDRGTKDRTNFKELLEQYKNPIEKDTVQFTYVTHPNKSEEPIKTFMLNGKKLEMTETNMHIFELLSELLTKISHKTPEQIAKDNRYVSDEFDSLYFSNKIISLDDQEMFARVRSNPDKLEKFAKFVHKPENIYDGIYKLKEIIQSSILSYLS